MGQILVGIEDIGDRCPLQRVRRAGFSGHQRDHQRTTISASQCEHRGHPGIVLARGPAIVSRAGLVFDASVDDSTKTATKITELASAGIIAHDSA